MHKAIADELPFARLSHARGIHSALRNRALSVAALVSTVASLLVLAIVLLITSNLERQASSIESRRSWMSTSRTASRRPIASPSRRTCEIPGVTSVTHISKDEALAAFSADTGRYDLVEALGYNPLPASFRLELSPGATGGPQMRAIAESAANHPGVEDVRYGGEWIERLDAALRNLRMADLIAAVLVGLAVVFAVSSTIRLTVLARRDMVEIMKDVGANDATICMPFLTEGIAQSLLAALFTLGMLRLVTAVLSARLGITIHFLTAWEQRPSPASRSCSASPARLVDRIAPQAHGVSLR